MTTKTKIILWTSIVLALWLTTIVSMYFNSQWYYYERKTHWQSEKQDALDTIEEANKKIKEFDAKLNKFKSEDLNYLNLQLDTEQAGD